MRKNHGRVDGTRRSKTAVTFALVAGGTALIVCPSVALSQEPVQLDEVPADEAPTDETTASDDGAVPAEEDGASTDASSEGSDAAGDARPSPLDATLGVRLYSRAFRYTGTINQSIENSGVDPLTDYNLDIGPMPFLNAHWYPLAHFMGGVPAHIGITGGYEMGIATSVNYVDPSTGEERKLDQSHTLWYAGLRGRIPVSVLTIGLGANYGSHSFSLDDDSGAPPVFPNVSYGHVEIGGDIEARFGDLMIGAQASYLYLLSAGDLVSDQWFSNATGKGVHFGAHVGWAAASFLHLLAGVDARAYGFDFNPIAPGTPAERVAGGATDRYMSFWLGARFVLPGSGGSGPVEVKAEGSTDFDSFDSFD